MRAALFLGLFVATSAFAQAAPQNLLTFDYVAANVTLYGVTGFQMQRKAGDCTVTTGFANLATVGPTLRTYTDLAVTPGVQYAYQVIALAPVTTANPKGNSDPSNCVAKMVPLPTIPAPTNLVVTFLQAMIRALDELKTGLLALPQ